MGKQHVAAWRQRALDLSMLSSKGSSALVLTLMIMLSSACMTHVGATGGESDSDGRSGDGSPAADGADGADGFDGADGDADSGVDEELENTKTLFPQSMLTPEMMKAMLSSGQYRGDGFRRANGDLFPSTVAPGKLIDMWISAAAYDEMLRVSPDRAGSDVEIPVGTMIVREVWDASDLLTLTVMVKLEKGAFPLGGDYWYTVTDPDGTVRLDEQGEPIAGLREDCGTCHLRRSHDGFLFGTPDGYLPE